MKYNDTQKKELKKVLMQYGNEEDIKDIPTLDNSDIVEALKQNNDELKRAISQMATLYQNAFMDMQKSMLNGIKEMQATLVKGEQPDWSGFFKDMPTMLSQIGDNTGKTSELIRNLKWNASQQIRNVSGSPINPSIAPFGITATYDDVQLSDYDVDGNVGTVQYYQNGNLVAQLSLTYTGGNLTDVTRDV